MKSWKMLFLALSCLLSFATTQAEESEKVKEAIALCPKGDVRFVEVVFPKWSLAGNRNEIAGAFCLLRKPVNEDDFEKSTFKATVVEHRELTNGIRVVIRFELVQSTIKNASLGLAYYACFDVTTKGTRTFQRGIKEEVPKSEDAGHRRGKYYGIPGFFDCTRPPWLGFSQGNTCEGYQEARLGHGWMYEKKTGKDAVTIQAVYFMPKDLEPKEKMTPREMRAFVWHGPEIADIANDKTKTETISSERQVWDGNKKDWLWREMERWDSYGDSAIRCRQIPPPEEDVKAKPENPMTVPAPK